MLYTILDSINVLSFLTEGNCEVLGKDLSRILKDIYSWILIMVPVVVLALCTVDMAKAVMAQDENGMVTARQRAIKRIIAGVIVFFVPIVVDMLLDVIGISAGDCTLKKPGVEYKQTVDSPVKEQ